MATHPVSRRRKKDTAMILAEFALSVGTLLYGAWMLMLGVGVVHHEWLPQLPTIGYGNSVLLMFLVSGVANATRRVDLSG